MNSIRVHNSTTYPTRTAAGLALLAALCAAANLTKPVHIDDTAYLTIANWVASNPLHPMSGLLNWGDSAQPISAINQPPLFMYLQALVQAWFGPSLLAQHALMAMISAAVVVVFYRLARCVGSEHAVRDTALLVLGPAFLPGQNLMMDVPTLLCWLICFWALLCPPRRQTSSRLIAGAVALAAGLLIKYTSLVLLPIFAITLLQRRQWRQLWILAIPLAALAGWSLFNLFDYGGIHVLARSVGHIAPDRYLAETASWVAGLGAVAPFTVMFIPRLPARRWLFLAVGLIAGTTWLAVAFGTQSLLFELAWAVILGNGCVALTLAGQSAINRSAHASSAPDAPIDDVNFVLVLWLAGAGAFIVLFAPFMAIRHVLLAEPALLLLLGRNLRPRPRLAQAGLVLTAALGIWLAASDFAYAEVYPDYAAQIAARLPAGGTHWTVGHLSWQWYAPQAGMLLYDSNRSTLVTGDILVVPELVPQQTLRLDDARRLMLIESITVNGTPLTWLRTMSVKPWGGYYSFSISYGSLPWTLSTAPLDSFKIYRVQ